MREIDGCLNHVFSEIRPGFRNHEQTTNPLTLRDPLKLREFLLNMRLQASNHGMKIDGTPVFGSNVPATLWWELRVSVEGLGSHGPCHVPHTCLDFPTHHCFSRSKKKSWHVKPQQPQNYLHNPKPLCLEPSMPAP